VTKAELIEEVSKVVEMTRKDSEEIVEAILGGIVGSLQRGEKIEIRGFGSFRTRQRQPRVGRNPKTGTRVEVPSKSIPYFKPGKELLDLVNQSAQSAAASSSDDAAVRIPSTVDHDSEVPPIIIPMIGEPDAVPQPRPHNEEK
jgi:integration host factor subunit beta